MRKVLITGGAGFVGRHLAQRLLDAGDEVHCVDKIAPLTGGLHPRRWPLFKPLDYDNFIFHEEDCRAFFARCHEGDFDYCFHLAAMVGGRALIEDDPLALADDLSIDADYWQWAKASRPGKSVIFSSSAVYPIRLQTRENHVLLKEDMVDFSSDIGVPDMAYGWAKLTCEYLGRLAFHKYGLKSIVYRPFSGYGEDQDDSYPFPSICKRTLKEKGKKTLAVWGTGDQMRDFIHIDDCVDGVLKTLDKIDDGGAVNLSTGTLTSFNEFAKLCAQACGYSPEITSDVDKPEGVFARGGDTQKQRELGFFPAVDLEDGVRRALKYLAQ